MAQGEAPREWKALAPVVGQVVGRLRDGQNVVVHCAGGLGRSGLVVACSLLELGAPHDEALTAVRAARPGAVEPGAQESFFWGVDERIRIAYPPMSYYAPSEHDVRPTPWKAELALKTLLRDVWQPSEAYELDRWDFFDGFIQGDRRAHTPLEALEVLRLAVGTKARGRRLTSYLGRKRLRRLVALALDVPLPEALRHEDAWQTWCDAYRCRRSELVEPMVDFGQFFHKPYELTEKDILIPAALRLDGWGYKEQTGFDWNAWSPERYRDEGDTLAALDACALFFSVQRFLGKWGGEALPDTDPHW